MAKVYPTTPEGVVRLAERFWAKVNKIDDADSCWEWTASKKRRGYGQMGLGKAGSGNAEAHRVSWFLHFGSLPSDGLFVLHKCDNPSCVRPSHLFAGTAGDNIHDMVNKGRHCAQNGFYPNAKLTAEQKAIIRAEYRWGNGLQLAERFGVSSATITYTVKRKGKD